MAKSAKKYNSKVWDSAGYFLGVSRIALGFYLLWAFLDKLIGLGFSTCRDASGAVAVGCEKAWVSGGSPTAGYLGSLDGTFAWMFQPMAGNAFADTMFMMGLLFIGLALILGIGMKIATVTGSLVMFSMYLTALPLNTNPLIDNHIIYITMLWSILATNSEQKLGLGRRWSQLSIVKKHPILI